MVSLLRLGHELYTWIAKHITDFFRRSHKVISPGGGLWGSCPLVSLVLEVFLFCPLVAACLSLIAYIWPLQSVKQCLDRPPCNPDGPDHCWPEKYEHFYKGKELSEYPKGFCVVHLGCVGPSWHFIKHSCSGFSFFAISLEKHKVTPPSL